jgi:hypothetical protein
LARELERIAGGASLVPARITLDLMRPVPMRALRVHGELVRDGKRIRLAQASIFDEETEVARATGLFLQRGAMAEMEPWPSLELPGPDGLETSGLFRGHPPSDVPRGFHSVVEARWASEPDALGQAAWFRMPMPLVQGEQASPLVRAMALGDFANAVASLSIRKLAAPPFINVDTTLYLVPALPSASRSPGLRPVRQAAGWTRLGRWPTRRGSTGRVLCRARCRERAP